MKGTPMKHHCTILATALAAALSATAKTFDWPIDATTAGARQFTAYHGETIRFNLQFKGAMTNLAPVCIYYQTNGMGNAEWFEPIPGTVFHPTNDCGAASYRFFIRCTDPDGVNYTANGTLRLLDSPGFEPSSVQLPVRTLDFSTIEVLNPPWEDRTTTNDVCNIVTNTIPEWEVRVLQIWDREDYFENDVKDVSYTPWTGQLRIQVGFDDAFLSVTNGATWPTADIYAGPVHDSSDGIVFANIELRHRGKFRNTLGLVTTNDLAAQSSLLAELAAETQTNTSSIATIGNQMNAIGATLNAENAHFVSTNYDSVVHLPEAYVEVKIRDEATGSNTWITIWQEMRRWTAFVGSAFDWQTWGGFHTWATNVTAQLSYKAERCWGIYDSETGGYSPEGYTQISSSNILIAAGMAYQRTVTSGGAVWVLQCNQGTARVGGDTNGFFRVVDGDGNVQFEIVKGDKREMGADASGITVGSGSPPVVTIPYSVEAAEHPTLQICDNLATANWKAETDNDCLATVSWSGVSGAYVATVQRKTSGSALFVKATFMAGGETYIRNVAPVGMDSIMLNGTRYYLGTATISGHTVLTLSTTAP